jgi:ABC-type dipeptide/oligopeptide/nickel transport system ATPase subunit
LTIVKYLRFENSKFVTDGSWWTLCPKMKGKGKKLFQEFGSKTEQWKAVVFFIRARLPRIIYFPNFLFQFPDKILVSGDIHGGTETQVRTNQYFVGVVKDALASLSPPLDIKKHIVDRVVATNPENSFSKFIQSWFGSPESESLEAVQERLSLKISDEVFGRWKSVLGRELEDTQIEIKNVIEFNEASGQREVYLTFRVKQGSARYNISERSLGFFTRFSAAASTAKSVVFLLDEPASNLHSKAQAKLLDSFEVIVGTKNTLIYSTHSHHLINPLWLENAHVVSNGVDVDEDLEGSLSSSPGDININVVPYKRFVGENAEKSHYFQPILDRLEYAPSKLEATGSGVLVEGKSDYYILNWFKKYHSPEFEFDFIPVNGASNARSLLSLYLGWCRSFVFLLDDDKEGREAKKSYLSELPVREQQVILYSDVFGSSKDVPSQIEELLSMDVKNQIAKIFSVAKPTKTHIQKAFSSALFGAESIQIDAETKSNFDKLMKYIADRLTTMI